MYEKHTEALAPLPKFILRIFYSLVIGIAFIFLALAIGIFGYHYFEGMSWIDAFVNAAMILSGMGPMGELHTASGKIFAGFYALFSGLVFILIIGLIFSPLVHRFFHKLHLDDPKK